MKISIGNPVQGDDFFDREKELKNLRRKLERDHILMLAPRRIGKTSLLYRLRETARDNQVAVYCSFSPCSDELYCIRVLTKAISENQNFVQWIKNGLDRIDGIEIAGNSVKFKANQAPDWRQLGEALVNTLDASDERWLIAVDEVPVFVLGLLKQPDGENRVRLFLNWFRNLRQRHYQRVRWILAGSIGLDTVASRLNLGDTINDLDPFPLGAFEHETAIRFIRELAESYGLPLDEPTRVYMIERIGWPVPYYLQLLFDRMLEQWQSDSVPPTADQVDSAFESLLSPTYKVHFDYWQQRLHEELGEPDAQYAIQLLNAVCRDSRGVGRATLSQELSAIIPDTAKKDAKLGYLLDVLINDGYLIELDERYQFRLAWLREYWRRRIAK